MRAFQPSRPQSGIDGPGGQMSRPPAPRPSFPMSEERKGSQMTESAVKALLDDKMSMLKAEFAS